MMTWTEEPYEWHSPPYTIILTGWAVKQLYDARCRHQEGRVMDDLVAPWNRCDVCGRFIAFVICIPCSQKEAYNEVQKD